MDYRQNAGYHRGQDRSHQYQSTDQQFVSYDDNMILTTHQNQSQRSWNDVQTSSGYPESHGHHAVHNGEAPPGQDPQYHQGYNNQDPTQALMYPHAPFSPHMDNPYANQAFVHNNDRGMIPMTTFNYRGDPNEAYIPTVNGFMEPPGQHIHRTGEDPTANDQSDRNPSLAFTIFMRFVSVLFIVLNLAADWIQYEAWVDDTSSNAASLYSLIVSQKKTVSVSVECAERTSSAITGMMIVNVLGSALALLQIVDIVGETLLDANLKGFQLMHGWNESLLTMALEEIPQVVVVFLLNNSCRYDAHLSIFAMINMFVGNIKTVVRFGTCKQEVRCECKSCCDCSSCCDFSECCMHTLALPCACRTLICQPCGKEDCIRFEKWEICKNVPCHCEGDSTCLGGYKKDPACTKRLYGNLSYWHFLLFFTTLAFYILKSRDVWNKDKRMHMVGRDYFNASSYISASYDKVEIGRETNRRSIDSGINRLFT